MKTASKCMCAMVCVVLISGVMLANPSRDVKSSPLFKASLAKSIAKLEGKTIGGKPVAKSEQNMTQTTRCNRPDVPETQGGTETCMPYCEETTSPQATCDVSCYGTCAGETCQSTCYNTCESTCASTCGSTCGVASACVSCNNPRVYGTVYKHNYSNNWYGATNRRVYEISFSGHQTTFTEGGYYSMYCDIATRNLQGTANHDGYGWEGSAFKPSSDVDQNINIVLYPQQ